MNYHQIEKIKNMKKICKKIVAKILEWEARIFISRHKVKIVAITGSIGKTSTKESINIVLRGKFITRASQKSYNSSLGVPLSILGLSSAWDSPRGWLSNIFLGLKEALFSKQKIDWLVLEVGADRPEDISDIARWLKTDIVVYTCLPDNPPHLEFFPSLEKLIDEKASLLKSLKKNGLAILNYDDERVKKLSERTNKEIFYYGLSSEAEIKAEYPIIHYEEKDGLRYPNGISFKIVYQGKNIPCRIPDSIGFQHLYIALPAVATGLSAGMNILEITEAMEDYQGPPGRMKIIYGIKDTVLIDDTYNSSPVALSSALDTLESIESSGRKIAVLGDMLELGEKTMDAHLDAGKKAGKFCDLLVLVGFRAKLMFEGAISVGLKEKKIKYFEDSLSAGIWLQNELKKGDIALFKASQGIRMEKAVEEVMAKPKRAYKLLCRQEKEWKKR